MADDEEMAISAVNVADDNADAQREAESGNANRNEDADASDEGDGEASSETDGRGEADNDEEEMPSTAARGSTDELVEEDDGRAQSDTVSSASSTGESMDARMADDGEGAADKNPLVKGSLPAKKTLDRQVKNLSNTSAQYIYFDQWKRKLNDRSTVTRLRLAFEQLLPRVSDDFIGC